MNNEFIWRLIVGDEKKIFKCVVLEDEVVTYEGDRECKHLKITNKEQKQNVLQIDTVTTVYGMECPFQLEKGVPYIKLDGKWSMSETTYEARKNKMVKDQKLAFILLIAIGVVACAACLIRYLVLGNMGDWWFLLILGSIMIFTAFIQRYEWKTQLQMLEKKDA